MKFMIADILDFARLKENKMTTIIERFDVREAVEEIIKIQEFQAMKQDVRIETHFINLESVNFKVLSDC